MQVANTFQAIAEEDIAKRECDGLAVVTLTKARWLLELLATYCSNPHRTASFSASDG